MTAKVYQFDSYRRELKATVRGIKGNAMILNRTIFYPTSGGQSCDTGFINDVRVIDVKIRDRDIFHYTEEPKLEKGGEIPFDINSEIICKIDWERRYANMQRHTGQHLLSSILFKNLKLNTISSHLGNGYSTIDVEWREDLRQIIPEIEQEVNTAIEQNIPVYTYTVKTMDELRGLPLRRFPKVNKDIRIVEIEGYDITPCGGTHLKRTAELWFLKITKIERYKGMWRITFISGKDFLKYFLSISSVLEELKEKRSIAIGELIPKIDKLEGELERLKKENNTLKEMYLNNIFIGMEKTKIQTNHGYTIYHQLFNEKKVDIKVQPQKALDLFSKKVLRETKKREITIFVLGNIDTTSLKVLMWSSPGGENFLEKIFSRIKLKFNARGGGKNNFYNIIFPQISESGEEVFNKILAEIG